MTESSSPAQSPVVSVVQLLRAAFHLSSLVFITWWALIEWPFPWPGILVGVGFFVLVVVLWALFLSPKPVLHVDRLGRGLIELLLIAGAVAAMLSIGMNWVLSALFGVAGAILGYFASLRG